MALGPHRDEFAGVTDVVCHQGAREGWVAGFECVRDCLVLLDVSVEQSLVLVESGPCEASRE